MLESCLSEYDEGLRGTVSWLPHPCIIEITSSVPISRRAVEEHKFGVDNVENTHERTLTSILCVHCEPLRSHEEVKGKDVQLLPFEIHPG